MYPPRIKPLANFFGLLISWILLSSVAANDVTENNPTENNPTTNNPTTNNPTTNNPTTNNPTTNNAAANNPTGPKNATARQATAPQDPSSFGTFCYVCRSDYDRACLNDFQNRDDFVKLCTLKEVERFNKQLLSDPPQHPFPKYDNTFTGRSSSGPPTFGCYTVMSLDKLFVSRACVPDYFGRATGGGGSSRASSCTTTSIGKEGRKARCISCSASLCNSQKADGSKSQSPSVFQTSRRTAPLILTMIMMLMVFGYRY